MLEFYTSGRLYKWLVDYLSDRTHMVAVGKTFSSTREVSTGVPQGSSLAPTLFILYVNDMPDYITTDITVVPDTPTESIMVMFADDNLLSISSSNLVCAARKTTTLLSAMDVWGQDWGMAFNASKTCLMLFSRRRLPSQLPSVYFRQVLLSYSAKHIHLGVTITADLKFNTHVVQLINNVARDLYLLRILAAIIRNPPVLNKIYKSYIRPKLEYACPVWSATTQSNVDLLEGMQRRAMRIILGLKYRDEVIALHYANLSLDSLLIRRLFATACCSYNLLHGHSPSITTRFCPRIRLNPYSIRAPKLIIFPDFRIPSAAYKSAPFTFNNAKLHRKRFL